MTARSGECLDDSIIEKLATGLLSPRELEHVRLHVPHCPGCRDAIRAHAEPETQAFPLTREVSVSWPKWLAVLVSLGALGASAWWSLRSEPPVPAANVTVAERLTLLAAPTAAAAESYRASAAEATGVSASGPAPDAPLTEGASSRSASLPDAGVTLGSLGVGRGGDPAAP